MKIVKSSGEKEPFSKGKFCRSLEAAGAPQDLVKNVCNIIGEEVKPEMTTSDIFRKASRHLMKSNFKVGVQYGLKRGIAELGPAGFHFEKFIEVVLQSLGYETRRNVMMKGKCVTHEVDIIAKKGSEHFLVEAKYHNKTGIKTHVDVAMYADARLQDISYIQEKNEKQKNTHRMWLVTNTKFTTPAIKYGECKNIRMTSWGYPKKGNLEEVIVENLLYPITVLPSLSNFAREQFAKNNMMLVRDLAPYKAENLVKDFNIDLNGAKRIIKDAHSLVYGEAE